MSKSRADRRKKNLGERIWTPPESTTASDTAEDRNQVLLGRRVLGRSINDLNMSTRGLGKKAPRVLDRFYMGLVYAHRLQEARQASPLEDPPSLEELKERFMNLDLASLHEPVEADVVDVGEQHGEVAVYVDYPSLIEEQTVMARAVTSDKYLDLPRTHDIVPEEARIVVVEGLLTGDGQLEQIQQAAPDTLSLSAMERVPQD